MDERRKLERYNLVIPTRIVLTNSGQESEVFEINTCNISAGGAFFKTAHKIPIGTDLNMNFVLPIEKLARLLGVNSFVKVKGKIIRIDMEGIAVSFNKKYEIIPYKNI